MTDAHDRRSPRHPDEDELVRIVDASVALRQLLAAASGPPSAAELEGRAQALAHFRAARRLSSADPERDPGASSQLGVGHRGAARLTRAGRWSAARLTVAGAALLTLFGGAAASAVAGGLPMTLRNAVSGLVTGPAPAGNRSSPTAASSEPPLQPGAGSTAPDPSPTRPPVSQSSIDGSGGVSSHRQVGATARQLAGLCRAYLGRQAGVSAAAILARPGFGPLITAAGGAPGVAAFCGSVRAAPPITGSPAAAPGRSSARPQTPVGAAGHRRSSAVAGAAPAASPGKPAPQRKTGGQPEG